MKRPFWSNCKSVFRVACLSACIATAWGVAGATKADAVNYQVSGSITPAQNLSNVYFVTSYYLNTSGFDWLAQSLGSFKGGQATPFSFVVNGSNISSFGNYTIAGIYQATGSGSDVTVALDLNNVNALGQAWETVFPEAQNSSNTYAQESAVAAWLADATHIAGQAGFLAQFNPDLGQTAGILTLVNFSNGTDGGSVTANVNPVPLPPTLMLMLPSLGVALLLRRKKSHDD